ncbi:MAG: MFS transporter [Planctomycetota bacterium]
MSARGAVALASYGHLLCHGAKVVLQVSLAVAAVDLGVGLVEMSWGLTAYGLAMGLMAVPAGLLSDRIGPTRVLGIYFWLLAGAAVLCATLPGFGAFVAAHALLGGAAGLYHPPGLALISLSTRRDTMGPAMGLHGVVGSLGIAFAPLLVLAVTPTAGWRGVYGVLALSAVAGGVAAIVLRRSGLVLRGRPEQATLADDGAISRRALVLLLAVVSINGFLLDGFMPLFPETVRSQGDLVWDAMVLNAAILSLGAIGQYVGGLFARGKGQGGRYMGLLALQPLVLLGAAYAIETPTVAVFQLAAFSFLNFMTQPMENRFLAGFTSSARRSGAYAMKFLVALVVGSAAPPVVAVILESHGHGPAYTFLAVVAVGGALAWWAFLRGTRASSSAGSAS